MSKIDLQRELTEAAHRAATAAKENADLQQGKLEKMVCDEAGISIKYLVLIDRVMKQPVSGGYYGSGFSRIFENAREKGIVKYVSAGKDGDYSDGHGMSSNAWVELGDLGIQIMRSIHGSDWAYEPPSARIAAKKAAAKQGDDLGGKPYFALQCSGSMQELEAIDLGLLKEGQTFYRLRKNDVLGVFDSDEHAIRVALVDAANGSQYAIDQLEKAATDPLVYLIKREMEELAGLQPGAY